jgi:hypothetical protein
MNNNIHTSPRNGNTFLRLYNTNGNRLNEGIIETRKGVQIGWTSGRPYMKNGKIYQPTFIPFQNLNIPPS